MRPPKVTVYHNDFGSGRSSSGNTMKVIQQLEKQLEQQQQPESRSDRELMLFASRVNKTSSKLIEVRRLANTK